MLPPNRLKVNLWFCGTQQDRQLTRAQVKVFQENCKDVVISRRFLQYAGYEKKLLEALKTEDPPTAALVSYNQMIELQASGCLLSLDDLVTDEKRPEVQRIISRADFLPDAWKSGLIGGKLYGLPLRRVADLPVYQYVCIFDTPETEEIKRRKLPYLHQLVEFLTDTQQQTQRYLAQKQWLPTRLSIYEKEKIELNEKESIRLDPTQTLAAMKLVSEFGPGQDRRLYTLLEGNRLNPYQSIGVIENGVRLGYAAPLTDWPVKRPSPTGFKDDWTILGAMFVEHPCEYRPGTYVVKFNPVKKLFLLDSPTQGSDAFAPLSIKKINGTLDRPVLVATRGSWVIPWLAFDISDGSVDQATLIWG